MIYNNLSALIVALYFLPLGKISYLDQLQACSTEMKTTGALALAFALAASRVSAAVPLLQKRDTEIIYLANCKSSVSCCTPDKVWSEVIVCSPAPVSFNHFSLHPSRC